MGATATKPRDELDTKALEDELAAERGEENDDDGLGPVGEEDGSGIPGGALPQDDASPAKSEAGDGEIEPAAGEELPTGSAEGGSSEPPTPPAALPDDGDDNEDAEEADSLCLMGDRELGLKVGGRKPDSAVLKYKGGKLDLIGPKGSSGSQFDRGDRFTTVDTWQVTGDNDQDTIDTLSGDVKSTSKAQNATLCGTKRIEDWLAERLREGLSEEEFGRVFAALDLEVPEV